VASAKDARISKDNSESDLLGRIANLLALLLVKGESQSDKVLTLTYAGYTAGEIANLLGMTPNAVSVTVYKAKRQGKRHKASQG
jgi:DNA-directed RNA polymerase specialized sigma24 family protein